jgi:nucleoside-diphosphate-sugar epimerase
MRILLTRTGGFFGRAIARELRARGHRVAGMRRRLDGQCVDDFIGDFFQLKDCASYIRDVAPEALIHCGWSGVPLSTRDYLSQYANIPASLALADLAADAGAKIIIGIGTQAEYGLNTEPVSEESPVQPVTHYGIAKLAAGQGLLRFAQQRGLRGVWLRLFGLYGPHETAPSMLPWLARQFAEGRRPQLTACTQAWDYLHVRDGARAVADVVESDAEGLFNLASGHAPPLRETVRMLRDVMAPQIEPDFGAVPFGPEQVHCLAGDVARLQAATGWAAQIPLEQGLAELALEAFDGLAS